MALTNLNLLNILKHPSAAAGEHCVPNTPNTSVVMTQQRASCNNTHLGACNCKHTLHGPKQLQKLYSRKHMICNEHRNTQAATAAAQPLGAFMCMVKTAKLKQQQQLP
jgi:hypothetical protein